MAREIVLYQANFFGVVNWGWFKSVIVLIKGVIPQIVLYRGYALNPHAVIWSGRHVMAAKQMSLLTQVLSSG